MGVGRQSGVVDAGSDLDSQGGHGLAQREHLRQSRRPLLRVGDAPPVGAAGGVGEDGVHPPLDQVDLQGVGALDARVGEGHEIDGGQGGRGLISVNGEHRQIEPCQGNGVAPDPTTQVRDLRHARGRVTGRMVGRDRQPGGLLQAVGGEEHLLGEGSELRCGPLAQALLRQRSRHQGRGVALLAQGAPQGQGLGGVVGGQGGQKLPALGGQEERNVVLSHHPRSFHAEPASGRDVHWAGRKGGSRRGGRAGARGPSDP